MANELGGSVATLNPRALIAPSSLSCPVTPVRVHSSLIYALCSLLFRSRRICRRKGRRRKRLDRGTRSSGVDRVRESTIRPTQEASSRRRRSEWGSELRTRELSNSFWRLHDSSDRIPKAKTPLYMWTKNGTKVLEEEKTCIIQWTMSMRVLFWCACSLQEAVWKSH